MALLRALHRLGQWRGLVSAHINARLRAAARGAEPSGVGVHHAYHAPWAMPAASADCRARKAQLGLSLAVCVPRPWQTTECPTLRTQTWAASWRSWP